MNKEKRVLVLGKNYSTPLGVIRSLGKSGYITDLLFLGDDISRKLLSSSKYVNEIFSVKNKDKEDVLSTLLNRVPCGEIEYVLFPTDDFSASVIDYYCDVLKQHFRFPHIIDGSILSWMDKSFQSTIAREVGFLTAKEYIFDINRVSETFPEGITFPCFVKPLVSAEGGKKGISACDNRAQLISVINELKLRNNKIMIQEKLDVIKEYTIDGVSNDQEIYIPAIIKKTRIAQHNKGITLSGELIRNEELGDSFERIKDYIRRVHYIGMFDLELLETKQGIYFGELNLRCGGPSFAYFMNGINLPKIATDLLFGISIKQKLKNNCICFGKEFFNPKVAWEDYAYLYISKHEINYLYNVVKESILADADDPYPEEVFYDNFPSIYKKIRRKKMLKQLIPKKVIQMFKHNHFHHFHNTTFHHFHNT